MNPSNRIINFFLHDEPTLHTHTNKKYIKKGEKSIRRIAGMYCKTPALAVQEKTNQGLRSENNINDIKCSLPKRNLRKHNH